MPDHEKVAQCLALMRPSFFSTRKIRDSSALAFSVGDIVSTLIGVQNDLSCSCFISFLAASNPLRLNFFSRSLIETVGDQVAVVLFLPGNFSGVCGESLLNGLQHANPISSCVICVFLS